MPPKVTVVVPVFNREAAVRRAIASVLAQTCQDFELIVVDDGSTDGTGEAVAALTDPRIRLIRHDKNRGGSAARNTGIRAGSAPYVAFLDSDDEWLPTKLERQLAVFESSSGQVALVYTGSERVYSDGTVERYIPRRRSDLSRALLTDNVVGETTVGMVRRSAVLETGGFDETLPAAQEMDLWLRLAERFAADIVPEALARVTKGDDAGRITANIGSTTRARELFRAKHREKMVAERVLHLHLLESGWWYHRGARDPREARRCYLEAVSANPVAATAYVLLLLTWVPLPWLDRLAGVKHGLTSALGRAARASDPLPETSSRRA